MMPIPEGIDKTKYHEEDSPGMQAFSFLRRGLSDCIAGGTMPALNVELASQTLWAGIHGITSLLITKAGFPWVGRDKVIHSTVDTLVAGVPGARENFFSRMLTLFFKRAPFFLERQLRTSGHHHSPRAYCRHRISSPDMP